MLICEELFLLLTSADGSRKASSSRSFGLVAAVVTDLVVRGSVTLSTDKDPQATVTDPTPLGDPVLDPALARLTAKDNRRMSATLRDGHLNPEKAIAASLAARGVVTIDQRSFLGVTWNKYPEGNPTPELQLRHRLDAVLHGWTPTLADVALLSILEGLNAVPIVLSQETAGMSRREVKARIRDLEPPTDSPRAVPADVGRAVKRAVDAMTTVLFITVATTT